MTRTTKFARSSSRPAPIPYFAQIAGTKIDRLTSVEVPAWSTSLFSCFDNPAMVLCAMTGIGVCVMHGHNQDALTSAGCCFSCCVGTLTLGECGRQRRYLRKRYSMSGGEYLFSGWVGDSCESLCCMPLTTCQETREIEIRSKRRWHWIRGFRGVGESTYVAFLGEETLKNVSVDFKEQMSVTPAWYEQQSYLSGSKLSESESHSAMEKPQHDDSMDK